MWPGSEPEAKDTMTHAISAEAIEGYVNEFWAKCGVLQARIPDHAELGTATRQLLQEFLAQIVTDATFCERQACIETVRRGPLNMPPSLRRDTSRPVLEWAVVALHQGRGWPLPAQLLEKDGSDCGDFVAAWGS